MPSVLEVGEGLVWLEYRVPHEACGKGEGKGSGVEGPMSATKEPGGVKGRGKELVDWYPSSP